MDPDVLGRELRLGDGNCARRCCTDGSIGENPDRKIWKHVFALRTYPQATGNRRHDHGGSGDAAWMSFAQGRAVRRDTSYVLHDENQNTGKIDPMLDVKSDRNRSCG